MLLSIVRKVLVIYLEYWVRISFSNWEKIVFWLFVTDDIFIFRYKNFKEEFKKWGINIRF